MSDQFSSIPSTPETNPEATPEPNATAPQESQLPAGTAASSEASDPESTSVRESDRPSIPKKLLLFIPLLLVGLGIGAIAINRSNNSNPEEPVTAVTEARLPVRAVPLRLSSIQEWVSGNGDTSALRAKHLTFEVSGTVEYIAKVNGRDLKEGDVVYGGQLLAQVDDRTLQADLAQSQAQAAEALEQESSALAGRDQAQAQVAQARAQVAQAEAQLDQQQSSVVSTKTQLQQAQASLSRARADLVSAEASRELATKDLERYRTLVEEGIETQRQLEVSESQFEQAEAQVTAAEAGVRSAEEEVKAARAAIQSAESQVVAARRNVDALESNALALESNVSASEAQINAALAGIASAKSQVTRQEVAIEDSKIVAPFDGIVAYLNIREGEYWSTQIINTSSYQNVVESVPIIIIDPREFEIDIELPAFQGSAVKPGQQAIVLLEQDVSEAQAGRLSIAQLRKRAIAQGRVFSVSPSVTPGGRAVKVTVRIPQGNENLRHGARVVTWIAVEERGSTTVAPVNAFVHRDRQSYIFIVQPDGTVKQQAVDVGIEGFSEWEILSDVPIGSLVVTEGKDRLVDGTLVEIIE
ncbi:efflux RND transporter periplasmic adaptor subunit [Roseofilum casamattae]|uniref:Efflux RND transporter periplasmic adaptor subunit n=1 Tax=Roseofilum casamattae BLCC-M143 TaxID=3022442 RepID=A0ABT7C2S6_9CYAN|nr:efflux RND transporter periplasmic adaptor subunit [Roseofilum casamattae]MDJ1185757.1 efflux RND transporter periplasmic adaptor subunit [Roseofilum casamattae BLCC-M143]